MSAAFVLRQAVDPGARRAVERHLLAVAGEEVLAEVLAELFEPVTEPPDDRKVAQDRVLLLRDVAHEEHQQAAEEEQRELSSPNPNLTTLNMSATTGLPSSHCGIRPPYRHVGMVLEPAPPEQWPQAAVTRVSAAAAGPGSASVPKAPGERIVAQPRAAIGRGDRRGCAADEQRARDRGGDRLGETAARGVGRGRDEPIEPRRGAIEVGIGAAHVAQQSEQRVDRVRVAPDRPCTSRQMTLPEPSQIELTGASR